MKQKFKPVAKADIRERVERKFRARGAVVFQLLVMLGAGILLLYNLPALWPPSSDWDHDELLAYTLMYGILATSGALHFIRYYFRYGHGRERYETETEAQIRRQLRFADAEDAEEQEDLVRLRVNDQLKNLRLVWQHLALYTGVMVTFAVGHAVNLSISFPPLEWETWRGVVTLFSMWGLGLAAHALRYVFAYSFAAKRREEKIEAQVAREMRRVENWREARTTRIAAKPADRLTIEPIEEARNQAILRTEERLAQDG